MTQKKIKLSAFLLLWIGGLQAQIAVPAAGGEATGSGGTVSYSVGQVVYTTHTGTGGTVSQGVQQSYDIFVLTGIELTEIDLELAAYPNPTIDFLHLQIKDHVNEKWTYLLYDLQGVLLENKEIVSSTSTISMENLPAAIYFLKVVRVKAQGLSPRQKIASQQVKTFKIIKK